MDVTRLEYGRYRSRGHYLSERQKHKYFHKVLEAYAAIRELPPVIAINYDPEARSQKLTADSIHYLADVELATKKALKTPELFARWKALVNEQPIGPELKARIVSACGEEYIRRKLTPVDYFRHIKTRPDRRRTAA